MCCRTLFFALSLLIGGYESFAQNEHIAPKWIEGFWDASLITHPTAPGTEYGVFHFRKTFNLKDQPEKFIVHVSADNRYKLFVNGMEVCYGSARGDIQHWRFETLDIAPHLTKGDNIAAALVWNAGAHRPDAQITQQTAFILQGNGTQESDGEFLEGIVNIPAPLPAAFKWKNQKVNLKAGINEIKLKMTE